MSRVEGEGWKLRRKSRIPSVFDKDTAMKNDKLDKSVPPSGEGSNKEKAYFKNLEPLEGYGTIPNLEYFAIDTFS